jgi:hypothetical protein
MRLLQEIAINAAGLKTNWNKIQAGGQGSGRHASSSAKIENVAEKHGFSQHMGVGGADTFHRHPGNGQTIEHNAKSDVWTHRNLGMGYMKTGMGHASLANHLQTYNPDVRQRSEKSPRFRTVR